MRKNSTVDHYALSMVSHMGQKSNNSDGKFMKRKALKTRTYVENQDV